MITKKLAAPLGLAALCVSGIAFAGGVDVVAIKNKDPVPHVVEYAVGKFQDCNLNKDYVGKQTIPPKSEYVLKIKGEPFACIRRPGGKWYMQDLRGKNARIELTIDD